MRPCACPGAQRGAALLGMVAMLVLVFAYVVTSRLNAASRFVAVDRDHNARVLSQAKLALIGYLAQQASVPGERNPGRLPCPEAVNAIGIPSAEGIAAPLVSPSTPTCATVGRLPWRTLGLEPLVDASGEPLWYSASPGWRLQTSSTLLTINTESVGSMTINGAADPTVIAVIIAPGPAMNVQAAAGCTARVQARGVPGPSMDPRDFLECFDAATSSFSITGPATSFNDQAVVIRTTEVIPALEAAIQARAQREIAPALRSAAFVLDSNSPRRWVATSSNPPIYPYPAPFADPTTSNFRGATSTDQGWLPIAPVAGFVDYQSTPGNAQETLGDGWIVSQNCYWESASARVCEGNYHEYDSFPSAPIRIEMTATFSNVAMGLRVLDPSKMTMQARDDSGSPPWQSVPVSYRAEMNDGSSGGKPRGSVTVRYWAIMPNIDANSWGITANFRMRIDRSVIGDHALASPSGRVLDFSAGTSAISNGDTVTGVNCTTSVPSASGVAVVLKTSGDWGTSNAAGTLYFSSVSGSFSSGDCLQVAGSTKATASGTDRDLGWLVRNDWHRTLYYGVAQDNLPGVLPSVGGCNSSNCLRFNSESLYNIRALLLLAGPRLATQDRSTSLARSVLSNYLEDQNADSGTRYEQRLVRPKLATPWNDRAVLVDWLPSSPPVPNVNTGPQVTHLSSASLRVYFLP